MEIKFIEYSEDNLREAYSDYIKRVEGNHDLVICTSALCITKYKKPKINYGFKESTEYIKTDKKIMNCVVIIYWDESSINEEESKVNIGFINCGGSVERFARMEDIEFN